MGGGNDGGRHLEAGRTPARTVALGNVGDGGVDDRVWTTAAASPARDAAGQLRA